MSEQANMDLEREGVAAATQPVQQYGATDLDLQKGENVSAEKLPLFLGLWQVVPEKLYRIGLAVYVTWFFIHRLADIVYMLTVDARFPPGLGHLYPSEAERLSSVSYTREVLLCSMLHRICVFAVVLTLILLGLFARFDSALRAFVSSVPPWWETSRIRTCFSCCCSPFWRCYCFCGSALERCMQGALFGPCFSWCSTFKHRMLNGRLSADLYNRFGSRLSWRELLFGSLYVTCFAACFFLISAPFVYWSSMIDLRFGFSNSAAVSATKMRWKIVDGFFSTLITGIPTKFVFLAVLQYRRGWLIMWALLIALLVWAQYNISVIAPLVLDMKNPFPSEVFAVGRGFPWVHTENKTTPWISLNRIYFKDPSIASASVTFSTRDKSKGQLTMTQHSKGTWTISRRAGAGSSSPSPVYAETISAVASHVLEGLRSESWSVAGKDQEDGRIGMRSGGHLRDALYGFAKDRKIGIAEIYMVDGSHKDIRANAFVAGAGNKSVIGLFDTLFLGQRNSDSDGDESSSMMEIASGDSMIQRASEIVQNVDMEEEERDHKSPRNSAPTQAMGDDEIVSILAHELAHAHLKHLEQGMVTQGIISFITFASLGWMAHSPLAAAALTLHAPLLHVGACAYDYVLGPPLEGVLKLFSDALTRKNEYEADAYAARISEKYATALQSSLAKLSVNANQDPDVPFFYEVLHHDHPTFARRWAHIEATRKEMYGK